MNNTDETKDDKAQGAPPASKKVGAVAVIGGGIAGMQASLDLADSGFKVYLIEKGPSIGGRMAQLDKTFPTLDCSMCILGPKLVGIARHPNIELLTMSTVEGITGEAGAFSLTIKKKTRFVDEEKCTGCGLCQEKCPIKISDEYNAGTVVTKNVRIPFPQAVPLVAVMDKEKCLYHAKGVCRLCEKACGAGAIDFEQEDRKFDIDVGSVIVATGFTPFDPTNQTELGYHHPDVLTSLEFERYLSASGPTGGHVKKPSDGTTPRRIAFIQCVGSRNPHINRDLCSSVCCMMTTKEAIIAKEHDPDIEPYMFYMDVRACGKAFNEFYERGKNEFGITYVRSRIGAIRIDPRTEGLSLKYEDLDTGKIRTMDFDMVVLGTGLDPTPNISRLAETLGLEIDDFGYLRTSLDRPLETNRTGIFVAGVSQGPKDIPETVAQASGAAAKAGAAISEARGELVSSKELPPEKDVSGKPRIGVFVCHCGINISSVVNVREVAEYAKTLDNVVHAAETIYACSSDHQLKIKEAIKEHDLNRIVVAACTPRTHEPLFQGTQREAGLNPHLFDLANIREHCSWVHREEKERATEKSKDLVRMSVERVRLLEPLHIEKFTVEQSALVVGGGVAGMTAALAIAEMGFPVTLAERSDHLGGVLLDVPRLHTGQSGKEIAEEFTKRVTSNELISVVTDAVLEDVSGSVGNFKARLNDEEIQFGAAVLATGGSPLDPEGYFHHSTSDKVITQAELETRLDDTDAKNVVMIQCVGSRENTPPRTYCSRICCIQAVKNAISLKERSPKTNVFVLFRDIQTYGLWEPLYTEARTKGVLFVRYSADSEPEVAEDGTVDVYDHFLGKTLRIKADLVVLSTPIVPNETEGLSQAFKVPVGPDGFYLEAHAKLRPVDFATDGVFLCGSAHFPKLLDETIAQANAVASRAGTIISKTEMETIATISSVDESLCRGCGFCVEVCPYSAVELVTRKQRSGQEVTVASVNASLCKGCGSCAAACLSGAMQQKGFTDEQLMSTLDAMTEW